MLGEASRNGYKRVCAVLLDEFKFDKKYFPSFKKLIENRPKMIPFELEIKEDDIDLDNLWRDNPQVEIPQDIEDVQTLLQLGADPNLVDVHDSTTPLGYAAKKGRLEVARLLLESGADKDLPVERDWATPKTLAEFNSHSELATLF